MKTFQVAALRPRFPAPGLETAAYGHACGLIEGTDIAPSVSTRRYSKPCSRIQSQGGNGNIFSVRFASNQGGMNYRKITRYGVLLALAFLLRLPFMFMFACSLAFILPCTFAFAFAGLAVGLGEVTAVALVFVLVFVF